MPMQPTAEQLREWWDGLSEPAKTALMDDPDGPVPDEHLAEVMQLSHWTAAHWEGSPWVVHLRDSSHDFIVRRAEMRAVAALAPKD